MNSHTRPLFKQNSILIFQVKICLKNILFVSKSSNNLSPSVFNTWFSVSSDQYNYETSTSVQGNFMKRFYKTDRYEMYSVTVSAVDLWSKNKKQLKNMLLLDLSPNKFKQLSVIFILNHVNNLIDLAKIYMTLLVPKNIHGNYFSY